MSSGGWDLEARRGGGAPAARGADLGDILERVLDKGVVIAGDIAINLLDIELLTVKLRLLVASADTAQAMGIDWWKHDSFLTGRRDEDDDERRALQERVARLEAALELRPPATTEEERAPNEETAPPMRVASGESAASDHMAPSPEDVSGNGHRRPSTNGEHLLGSPSGNGSHGIRSAPGTGEHSG